MASVIGGIFAALKSKLFNTAMFGQLMDRGRVLLGSKIEHLKNRKNNNFTNHHTRNRKIKKNKGKGKKGITKIFRFFKK